jgi:hypothetical protein
MSEINVVLIFVAVANIMLVAIMYFLRKKFPMSLTKEQQNVVIAPFTFVITLYAFLLSFVVINLWQTFSQADQTVAREAETIVVIYRLTGSFPDSHDARHTITEYVRSVVHEEWPAMADGKASPKTKELGDQIWQKVQALTASSPEQLIYKAELMTQLSKLVEYRSDRILLVGGSVPSIMWKVLLCGGLLLLVGLYYFSIGSTREQIVIDFIVIAMLLITVYLGLEFNAPFKGSVKISPEAFELIGNYIHQFPQ